jgi:hypothetical protein
MRLALSRGVNDAAVQHFYKGSERMNLGTLHAYNVFNLNPAHSQRVGDERTVATPWNRFRAPLLPGQFHQSV